MKQTQQPILFLQPQLKENIWGGSRLKTDYGYDIPSSHTGECWGISAHPNGDDTIKEGIYAGKKLSELWQEHRSLFGDLQGEQFPLLVKIIDAKEDLSIQVHPNDTYAAANENGSLGKTECWYILDCEEDSALVIGHNAKDKEELTAMIREGRWNAFIRELPVKKGDFIQIDPGTVHAIKGGIMLLETQQNSDITYRVYDYDRLTDGKPRQLHVEQSIDVITVPAKPTGESVKEAANLPKDQRNLLIACPYYKVWKIDVASQISFPQEHPFLIMSVVAGDGLINGQMIQKGDHLILPCGYGEVELQGKMEIIASAI